MSSGSETSSEVTHAAATTCSPGFAAEQEHELTIKITNTQLSREEKSRRQRNSSVAQVKLPSISGHVTLEPCSFSVILMSNKGKDIFTSHPHRDAHFKHCVCHPILPNNDQIAARRRRRRDVVEIFRIQPSVLRKTFLRPALAKFAVFLRPTFPQLLEANLFADCPFSSVYLPMHAGNVHEMSRIGGLRSSTASSNTLHEYTTPPETLDTSATVITKPGAFWTFRASPWMQAGAVSMV